MAEQDSESVAPRAASVDGEQSAPELSSAESRESQDEEAAPRSAAGTPYCVRCSGSMPGQDRYCRTCGWAAGVEPPPAAS